MQLKSFCGQPGVARCLHIPISSITQMTTSSKFPVSIFKFSLIQTGLWRMMRSGGSTLTVPVSSHHKDNIMKSSTSPDAFMGLLTYAERNYEITLSNRNQGSSSNFRYSNLFHFKFSVIQSSIQFTLQSTLSTCAWSHTRGVTWCGGSTTSGLNLSVSRAAWWQQHLQSPPSSFGWMHF